MKLTYVNVGLALREAVGFMPDYWYDDDADTFVVSLSSLSTTVYEDDVDIMTLLHDIEVYNKVVSIGRTEVGSQLRFAVGRPIVLETPMWKKVFDATIGRLF